MSQIRLACLDLAGTTVADGGVVERSFVEALLQMGVASGTPEMASGIELVRDTMGQSKISVFREVFGGDDVAAQTANSYFEKAYDASVRRGDVAPLPGAEDTITGLRAAGLKVCLTTGFSPVTRDVLLEVLGWTELVDLALSPADAGRGRPWPDMILTAIVRLEIDDVRQVAVAGDTANDLIAGWRSGASVVAGVLTGAHGADDLAAAPHTHVLDSISDLPEAIGL